MYSVSSAKWQPFCSDDTELIPTLHSDFPSGLFQPLAWEMVIFKMVAALYNGDITLNYW